MSAFAPQSLRALRHVGARWQPSCRGPPAACGVLINPQPKLGASSSRRHQHPPPATPAPGCWARAAHILRGLFDPNLTPGSSQLCDCGFWGARGRATPPLAAPWHVPHHPALSPMARYALLHTSRGLLAPVVPRLACSCTDRQTSVRTRLLVTGEHHLNLGAYPRVSLAPQLAPHVPTSGWATRRGGGDDVDFHLSPRCGDHEQPSSTHDCPRDPRY